MSSQLPSTQRVRHVVALASAPMTRNFARLVEALRRTGATVTPVLVEEKRAASLDDPPQNLAELRAGLQALAATVSATIRGEGRDAQDTLRQTLAQVSGPVDGVVTLEPGLAGVTFPITDTLWPHAVRVAVDGDFWVDPAWGRVDFDDLVLPHPGLDGGAQTVRNGLGRMRTGGVLVGGEGVKARRLSGDGPHVVVSFAGLAASDVDQFLFQLSLVRPANKTLLFLRSGIPHVDDLVRVRTQSYGLVGKRPRQDADPEPWVRGADVLVGAPAPEESAAAVVAGVPQVLFSTDERLHQGGTFLVDHGLATRVTSPIGLAVEVEEVLPGGLSRARVTEALTEHAPEGADGAARAVMDAVTAGRPTPAQDPPQGHAAEEADDDLEELGSPNPPDGAAPMSREVRRAYLREVIVRQKEIARQMARAREGLDSWQHRAHLAREAGRQELQDGARRKVDALDRILQKLDEQEGALKALRERFSSDTPLTNADHREATRFLGGAAAKALERLRAGEERDFQRLEIDAALKSLKDRLDASGS